MVNIGMNRYENGKIYKITDTGYNKVYVGSTCESLSKRIERHRAKYSSYKTGKTNKNLSVFEIFDDFGIEDCKIELIENYPCSCKEELLRREGHYIKSIDCVNKVIPHRTEEERKEVAREYYYTKTEKILEKHLEKNDCPFCKHVMSQYYVPIHQGSKNCVKQTKMNSE